MRTRAGAAPTQRGFEIEHRLHRLELDDHPLQAIGGMSLGIGHHDRQRLAGVETSSRANGSNERPRPWPATGRSSAVSTATTPGDSERGRGVDRSDRRVGLVGEHQAGVQ